MRLGSGVTIGEAARCLADLVATLEELGAHPLPQEYLGWVDECETRLRGVFDEPDITGRLHTGRYWHIYADLTAHGIDYEAIDPNLPMPDACAQETSMQLAYLKDVAVHLGQLRGWAQRPGQLVVYDTNALMHFPAA